MLATIRSKIKSYGLLILGALSGALYFALRVVSAQKRSAQERAEQAEHRAETAEARTKQQQKAEAANQQAKIEGEEHVEKAVERARSGDRRHFE